MQKFFEYIMQPEILSMIITAVVSIATAIYSLITKYGTKRLKEKATKIAEIVEQLYDGLPSDQKLQAFKDLCKQSHINTKKAVAYLETYIIPTTKNINNYTPITTDESNDGNNTEII